jgi:hypothetical protein
MKTITSAISRRSGGSWDATETTVYDCSLVELPRIANRAGSLTVMESGGNCPFEIKRVYYLYDVPGGASRGGHAHRELQQLVVATSGSFEVLVDDGCNRRSVLLNRPYYGLFIVPGIWRELHNFSSGSICLVLASALFDEEDYVRDHDDFVRWKRPG